MAERHPAHPTWIYAISVADRTGDLSKLALLLRATNFELRMGERVLLAQLFKRLRIKTDRRRTPMFKMSAERRLAILAEEVRRRMFSHLMPKRVKKEERYSGLDIDQAMTRHDGMARKDAIEAVAKEYGGDGWPELQEKLVNYMGGKRGATNRRKAKKAQQ